MQQELLSLLLLIRQRVTAVSGLGSRVDGGTVFGNEECRRDKVWQGDRLGDLSWLLGLCLPPLPSTEDPEILRPSNPKLFNLGFTGGP